MSDQHEETAAARADEPEAMAELSDEALDEVSGGNISSMSVTFPST